MTLLGRVDRDLSKEGTFPLAIAKEVKMALLKDLWNILVIVTAFSYFAFFTSLTYQLGKSALGLHQKGIFSLAKYNRMLVGK